MAKSEISKPPTGRRDIPVLHEDAYPEYPERPYEEAKKK